MELKKLPEDVQSLIESSSHINCFSKAIEELVCNCIDAEATSIAVRVNLENKSIQVVDNGYGITKNDITKVGEKHMTSKCVDNKLLKNIPKYYGYRGLTLAYIIDISEQVKIISRHESTEESWVAEFCKGKRVEVCEIGSRPSKGTTVQIKNFLYNLTIQIKKMNPVQELQNIKEFLEKISIIKNNLSLSLRDNSSNEIIFQMSKSQDIYQKISVFFGIDSASIQEFQVEKDKYKVRAFICKGINKQNQIIYLNGRYIEYCKLHKIMNGFFIKYLSKQGNAQYKVKSKHAYYLKHLDTNKKNIPFYILFLKCPYQSYNLYNITTNVNPEFRNWNAVTNLLEKLVNFYIGNGGLQKNISSIEDKNKLVQNEDIRDKVKDIVQRFLKNNSKISQLKNGVKGKATKRRKKIKKDITLSKIIAPLKPTSPIKINKSTTSIQHSCLVDLCNNKCRNKNTPTVVSKTNVTIGNPTTEKEQAKENILINDMSNFNTSEKNNINLKKYPENLGDWIPGQKYKYTKTKTRMDFSVLYNSKNICNEVVDGISLILNQFNKTHNNVRRNNYFDISKQSIKKKSYKVTINGYVTFPQTLKQINQLENNINKCLGKKVEKRIDSRSDLINTILNTQKLEVGIFNNKNKNVASDSKNHCFTYKENKHNKTCSGQSIPEKSINNCAVKNLDSDTHLTNNLQMIYRKPKDLIKLCSKRESNDMRNVNFNFNKPYKMTKINMEKHYKNNHIILKNVENSIPTYDSHQYDINHTEKSHHKNNVNNCVNKTLDQKLYSIDGKIKNKRHRFKRLRTLKKAPSLQSSFSIHESSDESKKPLIHTSNDVSLCFSQNNESLLKINESSFSNSTMFNNSKYHENEEHIFSNNIEGVLHNSTTVHDENTKNNENNINVILPPNSLKKLTINNINTNVQQNTQSDIFEDEMVEHINKNELSCQERNNSKHCHKSLITNFKNMYFNNTVEFNTGLDNDLTRYNKKIENSGKNSMSENNEILTDSRYQCIEADLLKNNGTLSNKKNEKVITETIDDISENKNKLTDSRYQCIGNTLSENISYLDKETGMTVQKKIIEDDNIFELKDRLRFIPKGFSPIFINCITKDSGVLNNCDYFNDDLYKKFESDVQIGTEVFEANIQNVKEYTSKEISKANVRIQKENADIAFNKNSLESLDVLKQVDNKFIAARMSAKKINSEVCVEYLVLFDQHAVDERINLEKNINDYILEDNTWKAVTLDSFTLPLTNEEAIYLHNYKDKFTKFGLQWTLASDREITVTAIPEAILGKHDRNVEIVMNSVKNLIQELVRMIKNQKGSVNMYPRSIMDLVASEACRYAIKFGDGLSITECKELLSSLQKCKVPFQCAHGRPVLAVLLEIKPYPPSYRINPDKLKLFGKIK